MRSRAINPPPLVLTYLRKSEVLKSRPSGIFFVFSLFGFNKKKNVACCNYRGKWFQLKTFQFCVVYIWAMSNIPAKLLVRDQVGTSLVIDNYGFDILGYKMDTILLLGELGTIYCYA